MKCFINGKDQSLLSSESRYPVEGLKSVLWSQTSKCACQGQMGGEEEQNKADYLQEGA